MHIEVLKAIIPNACLVSDPKFTSHGAKITLPPCSLLEIMTSDGPVQLQMGTLSGLGCFPSEKTLKERQIKDLYQHQLLLMFVGVSTNPVDPHGIDDWACIGEMKTDTLFSIPGSEVMKGYMNYWNKKWTSNDKNKQGPKNKFETSLGMYSPLDAVGETNVRAVVRLYAMLTMSLRDMHPNEREAMEKRLDERCSSFAYGFQEMFLVTGMGMLYGAMVLDQSGGSSKGCEDKIPGLLEKYGLSEFMGEDGKREMESYLGWGLKELRKRGKKKSKESGILIPYADPKAYPLIGDYTQMSVMLLMELLFTSSESTLAGINTVSPLAQMGDLIDNDSGENWLEVLNLLSPWSFTERVVTEKRNYSKRVEPAEVEQVLLESYAKELLRIVGPSTKDVDGDDAEPHAKRAKTPEASAFIEGSAFATCFRGMDAGKRDAVVRHQLRVALKLSPKDLADAEKGGCLPVGVGASTIVGVSKFYRIYFSQPRFDERHTGTDPETKLKKPPRLLLSMEDVGGDKDPHAVIAASYRAQLERDLRVSMDNCPEELMHNIASDGVVMMTRLRAKQWPDLEGPCYLKETQVIEPGPMGRPVTQTLPDLIERKPFRGGAVPVEERMAIEDAPRYEGNTNAVPFTYTGTRAFLNMKSYCVLIGNSNSANLTLRVFPQMEGSKFGIRIQQRAMPNRGSDDVMWTCYARSLTQNREPSTGSQHYGQGAPPSGLYGHIKNALKRSQYGADLEGEDSEPGYYSA